MPSQWVQAAVDNIRGENAFMHKQVPESVGRKHVTELLGQHPFHPFDPAILENKAHPCYEKNLIFYQCMNAMGEKDAEMPLHMKHVNCYHPFKTDLMKCLVQFRKAEKEKMQVEMSAAVMGKGEQQQQQQSSSESKA